MKRAEGIKYLNQCADNDGKHWWSGYEYLIEECRTCNGTNDASHLGVPGGRYGTTTGECAPVAWRVAYLISRETGQDITIDDLEHAMSLVVNSADSVASIIRNHGYRHYT